MPENDLRFMTLKRRLVLPAVVLIQTCLGGIYAWSAFVPRLRSEHGFTSGQTQLVFGLTIAVFTLAMVLAGRLLVRWGPRCVGLLGGLLFICGYLVAAAAGGRFLQLLAGIGLIGGASIGFGYVAALTTGIQWFPKKRGLVTGISVAGFGGGAILLSSLAVRLMGAGWKVLDVLRAVGWGYGAAVCLGALLLFRPPSSPAKAARLGANGALGKDPVFRALVAGIFCGTFAGLLVIGNLKPIGLDGGLPLGAAALAIGFFAIGNAVGRITWGWISDRIGYVSIPLSLVFLAAAIAALLAARATAQTFSAAALLVGFGFGACFVLYAAQVAARFGSDEVPKIYPLVFLAYGVAGITGPPLGGHLHDLTASHLPAMAVSVALLLLGAGWTWRIRREIAAPDE